ncbi:hypothetical protein LJC10_00675 [Selenomonadales bacterium OttesenSCG-928-I06]|nr:hypothetical protein [Selenomonadales bacterium OttesenSCG-928-I06]
MLRICKNCGIRFKAEKTSQKYCNAECRIDFFYNKSKSKKIEKKCEICGVVFITSREQKKYCSNACYVKANKELSKVYHKNRRASLNKTVKYSENELPPLQDFEYVARKFTIDDIDDDIQDRYKALLACIVSKLTVTKALGALGLMKNNKEREEENDF